MMINPFGEDDDDFEVNSIIDSNLEVDAISVNLSTTDRKNQASWLSLLSVSIAYTVKLCELHITVDAIRNLVELITRKAQPRIHYTQP